MSFAGLPAGEEIRLTERGRKLRYAKGLSIPTASLLTGIGRTTCSPPGTIRLTAGLPKRICRSSGIRSSSVPVPGNLSETIDCSANLKEALCRLPRARRAHDKGNLDTRVPPRTNARHPETEPRIQNRFCNPPTNPPLILFLVTFLAQCKSSLTVCGKKSKTRKTSQSSRLSQSV